MAKVKINQAGMRQLQRDLEKRMSAGIRVPLDGSEADAIRSVKDQIKKMGATPDDAEVRKMVREARQQA
ncbi:hypothetical protein A5719_03350 [Mycolicibacterium peregrinum]|uniref:hypothetical protein n=1 Tax=Mycolicibacterium peregrinum TaxID=43304 RepID=UPI0007EB89A1|nr:hypothetical protein [Mycolicibacterium peregrinum]OBF42575.1 hypothetical protein A5719_03350 [Mycolicibacterium peregrinum]